MPTATLTDSADQGSALPRSHVLFVDDEPHLLDGLRRMLRSERSRWDTSFVTSGAEALALMDQTPVDAIVSDMRMPGMDGAQLLAEVQRRQPSTVRIILSGQADRSSVVSAIHCTQQFLAKPCDQATLTAAVNRALEIRRMLDDPALRDLIGGVASLPTLPAVYHELVAAMEAPEVTIAQVANILASDVATSAEMLKLVNSAFFGLTRDITSVADAASLLGLDNIQALLLAGSVFQVDTRIGGVVDVDKLRNQALHRAAIARVIGRAEGWTPEEVNRVTLSCMLLDVGVLALAQGMPEQASQLFDLAPGDPASTDPVQRAERQKQVFGCSVPQASAHLLGLWAFAPSVVHLVACQPVTGDEPGTTRADLLVAYAQRRALDPLGEFSTEGSSPRLDDETTRAWDTASKAVPAP